MTNLSPEQLAANEDFWFGIQQAFTEDRNIINLNNGTIQNGLRIVQDAVRRHNEFSSNAAAYSMMILAKGIESCRRRLAALLGCDSEELVICRGGTEAGQIPIMGLDLKPGDEVVITNQDYPRLISSWKQREKREGIVLKIVPLPAPPVPLDQFCRLVEQQVTPRTKMIHVCHMTHRSGQMALWSAKHIACARLQSPEVLCSDFYNSIFMMQPAQDRLGNHAMITRDLMPRSFRI